MLSDYENEWFKEILETGKKPSQLISELEELLKDETDPSEIEFLTNSISILRRFEHS